MTTPGSLDDRITAWLDDGPSSAPRDLFAAVVDATTAIPQGHGWIGARRAVARPLIVAAAVTIAVLGLALLMVPAQRGGPGAAPTATATPSAESLAEPGGSGQTELAPGSYLLTATGDDTAPRVRLTIPAGWRPQCGSLPCFAVFSGSPADRVGVGYWVVESVYPDPCHPITAPALGPSVEDLASALSAIRSTTATNATPARLGQARGLSLDLTVDREIACDPESFHLWSAPGNLRRYIEAAGETIRVWILDVGGSRVVLHADSVPGASASKIAEALGVVASASFEP